MGARAWATAKRSIRTRWSSGRGPFRALRRRSFQTGGESKTADLHIRLREDKIFTAVEVACGDTHPEPKSDGRDQRGWSKLYMGLKRSDGRKDWFTTDQNVPPRGVLMGAPTQGLHQVEKGDELIISARGDTSYVMALRVWYDSKSAEGEEAPC